ncbi:hypothetical protein [Shewanella waksmanii]|uniref:hypothetical protein n=1 Tax=Shewanella waksmanii TaxID=213783 RepID=UPI003735CC1C
MLPKIFSDDAYISLATQQILASVLQDESLKLAIEQIVNQHLKQKLQSAADNQLPNETKTIIAAANQYNNNIGKELNQYQTAIKFEQAGFQALVKKDFESALVAFNNSTIYHRGNWYLLRAASTFIYVLNRLMALAIVLPTQR